MTQTPIQRSTQVMFDNMNADMLKNMKTGMEMVTDDDGDVPYGALFCGSHVDKVMLDTFANQANQILGTAFHLLNYRFNIIFS